MCTFFSNFRDIEPLDHRALNFKSILSIDLLRKFVNRIEHKKKKQKYNLCCAYIYSHYICLKSRIFVFFRLENAPCNSNK